MSVIGSNVLAGASGSGAAGYKIERSLRFNDDDGAYLGKTLSAGNRQTWTWSGWVKRSSFGSRQQVFGAVSSGSSFGAFEFNADDELRFYDNTLGDSNAIVFETGRVFRDPSAWYHIVVALDSTAGTDAERIKLYVNGVQEESSSFSTGPTVASNGEGLTNSNNVAHNIGSWTPASSSLNLNAYLAETHFIDGQALDQYSFGEFDDNGLWQPKEFTPSTEYSTTAITSVTALNTSFTTDAGTSNAFGSGNIDEGTFDRKTNGGVLDVTLSPAQSGNFVVYTGSINETSNYTIVFEYSDGTTQTVLNNSTSTRNGPGNTCTVNVGQKSNVVGFTVDCQDNNDSQLCGVTVDGTRLVTGQAYGKQVTLTDGTNLDQFPVNTVVSNGDKVIARDTTNNTLSLDGTSWAAGQYVTKGGYGTNGFYLDFSDNSSVAALGTDSSGNSNTFTVNNLEAGTSYSTDNSITSSLTLSGAGYILNGLTDYDATMSNSGTGAWIEFNPPGGIAYTTSVEVMANNDSNDNMRLQLNGGSLVNTVASNTYVTLATGSGTINKIRLQGDTSLFRWRSIRVDGVVLKEVSTGTDSLLDSPSNYEASSGNNGGNYATLNPLDKNSSVTLANGNLDYDKTGSSGYGLVKSTIAVSSGKWYCEYTLTGNDNTAGQTLGVTFASHSVGNADYLQSIAGGFGYYSLNGNLYTSTGSSSYGSTFDVGDTIGIALDMDNGKLFFSKNGVFQNSGNPVSGTNPAASGLSGNYVFGVHSGTQGTTAPAGSYNFGQRPFAYTPPTGFVSLCTTNLPDPLIAKGSTAFDTKTWSGNNSSTNSTPRSVNTYSFSPDLVWIKNINSTEPHNIYDTVRGEGKYLYPHDTNQENDAGNYGLTGFLSNGFSLLDQGPGYWSVNANTRTYVGWAWDGGDLVTNSTYNQSQTWSDLVTGTLDTQYGNSSTAAPFDGDTGSSYSDGIRPTSGNYLSMNFGTTFANATSVKIYGHASLDGATYAGANENLKINGTAIGNSDWANNGGSAGQSSATFTLSSGLTSLEWGYSSGSQSTGYLYLQGIEVDGKLLTNPGRIPVGSLNSSLYNQDQIWSTYGTFTGSYFNGIYTWDNVFSADMGYGSTGALYVAAGGTLAKWVLTSSLTCNSEFKFYCYNNTTITLNEGLSDEVTSTSTGGQSFHYHTIPFSGQIHSVKMASTVTYLIRLFVDGKALIDSDVTMPNVPSISSTVRTNPEIGFSIMTLTFPAYTGGSSVAHGLNAEPHWWMMKDLDSADSWYVGHRSIGAGNYLKLDLPTAPHTSTTLWDNQLPDSNFIYNNATAMNDSGRYVMYLWAPVEGYSKFGMYDGNSSNYPFVFTGFRPALIITKRTDANGGWVLWDTVRNPHNPAAEELYPDDPSDEYTGGGIDILSNGFKLRNSSAHENTNSASYVYAAFAEHPFKTARAR